jgi:transposase-like protein
MVTRANDEANEATGTVCGAQANIDPVRCPQCNVRYRQIKWGKTQAGSQRYRCHDCMVVYTPQQKQKGHPASVVQEALKMYMAGAGIRQVARDIGVSHQTVSNWINAPSSSLLPFEKPST